MRIAMIGPFGLRPKGTMAVRALPLARELAARGHAVLVVMPPWHPPAEAPRRWQEGGVQLAYVSLGPRWPGLSHLAITLRLARHALAWGAEVIHCFKPKGYSGLALLVLWLARRLGLCRARLVVDEDDWEGPGGWNDLEPYSFWLRRFFAWQERWGLRHSDAVTVASRTLQSLVWALGVPPARVFYLPNGTAGERSPGDGAAARSRYGLQGAPVVLLYTRFFEYDPARAVEVFRRIVQELPEARLLVVGRGLYAADEARFLQAVHAAGLDEAVVRAGWVPQEELADHFAAADVAIYPFDDTLVNRSKCSVKLLDLLAAGVPTVADAVGQNTEYIIQGETGLLVPSGDVAAMARATLRLLQDQALRRALSVAAAQRSGRDYAWRVLAEVALAAYACAAGASSPYALRSAGGGGVSGSGSRPSI